MTSTFRRRRLLDRSLAAGLALVVAVAGILVYRSSDIRNADLVVSSPGNAPSGAYAAASVPSPSSAVPTTLTQKWTAATDPALGVVSSESGVVVTADTHTISAHDAVSGVVRWTYTRSNRTLCAIGSGDTGPADMTSSASIAGIATVYGENGFCSQVMTFDPVTGARGKVRTSPGQENGSLVFGSPYGGWLGATRLEVWRYDLVRTIQYGDQANPPKPGQSRLGCTFTDLAMTSNQFAAVEHCPSEGANARVVLNFDDPGAVVDHPDGWDVWQHYPRTCVPDPNKKGCADIDTGAAAARIVGLTADRVAVLVSGPKPAVVVYDATGKEASRTPVDIPAADIIAADSVSKPAKVTPAVQTDSTRLSLVGDHLLAVSTTSAQVPPPATAFSSAAPTTTSSSNITDALNPSSSAPTTVSVSDLTLSWVADGALGLPAAIGTTLLMPTDKGLETFDSTSGPTVLGAAGGKTITVDRQGYTGRVDASAIGSMIIEDRGDSVVALG
ncbi:hypothetical protein ABIB25_000465 [Nakamurella sp. UYEF19]|uniref:Rv3212 family protein n=1 Tax=Nakamurella sp. UYEF19 TaxID=1756392 RepID=UPI003392FA63